MSGGGSPSLDDALLLDRHRQRGGRHYVAQQGEYYGHPYQHRVPLDALVPWARSAPVDSVRRAQRGSALLVRPGGGEWAWLWRKIAVAYGPNASRPAG